ncbi:hypothetical protein U1Q18_009287, partial [Sarracenia purpurea var. burkii]
GNSEAPAGGPNSSGDSETSGACELAEEGDRRCAGGRRTVPRLDAEVWTGCWSAGMEAEVWISSPPTGFVFSPSMESLANLHERSSSGTD